MKILIVVMLGLPFTLVGFISLWVAFSYTLDFWRTQHWQPAPVEQLINKNAEPHTRYAYLFKGVVYIGVQNEVRVHAIRYSDALASQEAPYLKTRLEHMGEKRKGATLFVNPDKPTRAIIPHKVPLKKIVFSASFGLIFFLSGAGVIYIVCRLRPPPNHWSDVKKWQTAQIHCQTKAGLFCPWFFALAFTSFGVPMCVQVWRSLE